MTILLAIMYIFVSGATYRPAAHLPRAAVRLDTGVKVHNLPAADKSVQEACGWYSLTDEKPECPEGYYLAFVRYERTADGFKRVYEAREVPKAEEEETPLSNSNSNSN